MPKHEAFVLRKEALAICRREEEIARRADVATLVNPLEAETLAKKTKRPVAWTPMSVEGPEQPPLPVDAPRPGLVFVGGLDYAANIKSVLNFDTEVRPVLAEAGVQDAVLHVLGFSTEDHRRQLSSSVILHGYVDDLHAEMRRYEAMLVPEVDPGGIKTKIIQAAFHGVVVLAHTSAVRGTRLIPGKDLIVWEGPEDLAIALNDLRSGVIDRQSMVRAAHDWARRYFGHQIVRELWAGHIDTAIRASHQKKQIQEL